LATTLGTAADFVDLQSHMNEKDKDAAALRLTMSAVQNLSNKTWLTGVSDIVSAIDDPGRYLPNVASRLASTALIPGIVAQGAEMLDPVQRDTREFMDRIRARIPFVSRSLPPSRDAVGRTMVGSNGGGLSALSPMYTSTDRNDPTLNALLQAGIGIGKPERSIADPNKGDGDKSAKIMLSPQQYDNYQFMTGEIARPKLADLVSSPEWAGMSAADKEIEVDAIMRDSRQEAREALMLGQAPKPAAKPLPPGYAGMPDPYAALGEPVH